MTLLRVVFGDDASLKLEPDSTSQLEHSPKCKQLCYNCGGIVNYGGIEGSIGATNMTFSRVAQAVPRPCSDGMETFNTSSSHGCATTGRFRVA